MGEASDRIRGCAHVARPVNGEEDLSECEFFHFAPTLAPRGPDANGLGSRDRVAEGPVVLTLGTRCRVKPIPRVALMTPGTRSAALTVVPIAAIAIARPAGKRRRSRWGRVRRSLREEPDGSSQAGPLARSCWCACAYGAGMVKKLV